MMNDNDLKQAWQKLALDKAEFNFQSLRLQLKMEQEINKFESRIQRRDHREIITAICLLLFFSAMTTFQDGYKRIGSIFLSGYFIWVVYYLIRAKARKPGFSISKSIKEQLIEYRSYVLLQQRLVKNVLYWYILPMIPGVLFFYWGMESKVVMVGGIVTAVIIIIYVYRLNQRAAKENYAHLLMELNRAIVSLEV